MRTEAAREFIKQMAMILRRASFRFHDLSACDAFLSSKNEFVVWGKAKPPEATAKNTWSAFQLGVYRARNWWCSGFSELYEIGPKTSFHFFVFCILHFSLF